MTRLLEQLEELYDAEGRFSCYGDLLEAVRQVFLGFCVQRSRLRATARAWQEALHDVSGGFEDATVLWAAWHSRIAAMLVDVDFVTWLVPDDSVDGAAFSTFRDGVCQAVLASVQLCSVACLLPGCCHRSDFHCGAAKAGISSSCPWGTLDWALAVLPATIQA